MERNFGYLFAAYLAILLVIFLYVYRMFRAQKRVEAELDAIKRQASKRQ